MSPFEWAAAGCLATMVVIAGGAVIAENLIVWRRLKRRRR